jgi:RNA polymerase sigma-70 factor (ECF subfamily)
LSTAQSNGLLPGLATLFEENRSEQASREPHTLSHLNEALEAALDRCHRAWPRVRLDAKVFIPYLAARVPPGMNSLEALRTLHVEDLYLACACAKGDARAIAILETQAIARAPSFVSQPKMPGLVADELRQVVRTRILVATDGAPRIAQYTGRGPLGAWVRVVTLRAAADLRRSEKAHRPLEQHSRAKPPSARTDPELRFLRGRYERQFRAALETTLAQLSRKERNVLRMHHLDGMSTNAIGKLFKVHGTTVLRWIMAARERIVAETRRLLHSELDLDEREVDSVLAVIARDIDVSVRRWLERTNEPGQSAR